MLSSAGGMRHTTNNGIKKKNMAGAACFAGGRRKSIETVVGKRDFATPSHLALQDPRDCWI